MKRLIALLAALLVAAVSCCPSSHRCTYAPTPDILPGATDLEAYLPLLEGKRVSILSNQTGLVAPGRHVLDTLLSLGVNVVSVERPMPANW